MNRLFEEFVTIWLQIVLRDAGIAIQTQPSSRSIILNADTGRAYGSVRPDVMLRVDDPHGRRFVPAGAKYELYDQRRLDSADVH